MKILSPLHIAVAFLLVFTNVSARADSSPAESMLNFFGSTCVAKDGSFTKAALVKSLYLAGILQGIKDDEDCKPLSAAASQANAISDSLSVLENKISNNQNYSSQEQAILTSMAMTTDPKSTSSLQDLLVKVSVNKKLSNYEEQAFAAKEMVVQTNILVQQAISNQKCLFKKPNVLSAIGSLVSAVGIAATVVNPAIGLGASVGGNMLSNLVNLVNQSKQAKKIRKIKNEVLKPEVISCVLESLSNDYCRATGAVAALDWKAANQNISNFPITSSSYALRLVDREIPVLVKWLTSLRMAAKSQNIYDGSQVSDFKSREALYEASPSLASGVIESAIMNPNDSVGVKWSVLSRTVKTLVGVLMANTNSYESSSKNPLFQVYSPEQALFYLIGFSITNLPSSPGNGQIKFEQYNPNTLTPSYSPALPPAGINYDLKELTTKFNDWFTLTAGQVSSERSRVLKQDPEQILDDAFKTEQTQERISPYQAIVNLLEFLKEQQKSNPTASESLFLLTNTIKRLTLIQEKLDSTHALSWVKESKGEKSELEKSKVESSVLLADIYKVAELGSGVVFIENRLRSHADAALIRYLTQSPSSIDQSVLAQTLASNKMTEILLLTNSGKNRGDIREDIINSMTITLPTFDHFVDNYQYSIRDVLLQLMNQEKLYGPKVADSFSSKRARICLLLTQAVTWPSAVSFDLCSGTSFSILPNGPKSSPLSEATLNQDLTDRSCKLYNLKRDTLIYETRQLFNP